MVNNDNLKILVIFGVLIAVGLLGCAADNSLEIANGDPNLGLTKTVSGLTEKTTNAVSLKPTQTPTLLLTRTQEPIQSLEEKFPTYSLLLEYKCDLPCHLGIIPGETDSETACDILQSMDPHAGGCSDDRFGFELGENRYHYYISGDIQNGKIISMDFELFVKSEEIILTYFPQILISSIFQELGYPDEILIDPSEVSNSFKIHFRYLKLNIVYELVSASYEAGKICINPVDFGNEPNSIQAHVGISLPGREMIEAPYFADVPRDWLRLEEVLGISNLDFYNQVLENPSSCFDIVSK